MSERHTHCQLAAAAQRPGARPAGRRILREAHHGCVPVASPSFTGSSPRPEGTVAFRSRLVRPAPGFTLIEVMVAIAVIGAVILLVATRIDRWRDIEAVKSAARNVEGAFAHARSEAIRTGNHHILFIRTDIAGDPLEDADGNQVPILILDDGRPGSADQNCLIDAGESFEVVRLERGVDFGATAATATAPLDQGGAPFATGSSFEDTAGNPADWVLFRPDGMPRSIDAACAVGALGSGGGGVYLSNAERDVAVVLTPLGAARVFAWNSGTVSWH